MAEPISLTFADGETMHFPAIEGESVLVSAEKAGNVLANNCREGTCRTCVAFAPDGSDVLLCVTPARSGLDLRLPYRRVDVTPASLRRAKINGFSRVSPSVWEIRYRLQFPLPFLPGQYVEVIFPGMDQPRRFSMANPPSAKEQVLHVRDLPGGAMSAYLRERAKPEDAFTVRGPFGVFYLRSNPKPKLFVAGGTGLAPILSMLSAMEAEAAAPLAIVTGFASDADAYALDTLHALKGRLPLEIVAAADSASPSWAGFMGKPVEALKAVTSVPLASGTAAYLCGPPGMVSGARAALSAYGLPADDIRNEVFVHTA